MINFIAISDFCYLSTWLVTVCNDLSAGRCSQIIAWFAFTVKSLKSDTVAVLTRSSSLNRCITLVCFMNFYNEYLCFCIWRSAISLAVRQVGR